MYQSEVRVLVSRTIRHMTSDAISLWPGARGGGLGEVEMGMGIGMVMVMVMVMAMAMEAQYQSCTSK